MKSLMFAFTTACLVFPILLSASVFAGGHSNNRIPALDGSSINEIDHASRNFREAWQTRDFPPPQKNSWVVLGTGNAPNT